MQLSDTGANVRGISIYIPHSLSFFHFAPFHLLLPSLSLSSGLLALCPLLLAYYLHLPLPHRSAIVLFHPYPLSLADEPDIRDILTAFVTSHKELSFLGLALTDASGFPIFTDDKVEGYDDSLRVTGEATEKQVGCVMILSHFRLSLSGCVRTSAQYSYRG